MRTIKSPAVTQTIISMANMNSPVIFIALFIVRSMASLLRNVETMPVIFPNSVLSGKYIFR